MKRVFKIIGIIIGSLLLMWIILHLSMHSGAITSPFIVAHRGNSELAPENTEAAILKAIEQGIKHIEIDIQRTSDNILVLMHDNNIERTTDGVGLISEMTWEEVSSLDAGSYFSSEFAGEGVPTLNSILELVVERDIKLYVEVKNPEIYPGIENQIIAAVKKYQARDQVVIISFDLEWLEVVQKSEENIDFGQISLGLGKTSRLPEAATVHVHWASVIIDPTLVKRAHDRGYQVIVWTVNDLPKMKVMLLLGVDGITTNSPGLGMKAISSR